MTTAEQTGVVLVHGAWHDGSCWAPVVAALGERGITARAVDLPSAQPGTGLAAYVEVVVAAAREVAGPGRRPVVLVGHSLGGLVVPVAAAELGEQAAAVVLVGALVLRPGASWRDRMRAEPHAMVAGYDAGQVRNADRTTSIPPEAAVDGLYAGVAEEAAPAAVAAEVARMRPQDWTLTKDACPLEAWPAVRTVGVVCAADRVVDPAWVRAALDEVGAEVVELPGGHFPMLTRPEELAAVIADAGACAQ